jgi:predicted permease
VVVSPGYFQTLDVRLQRGRTFRATDGEAGSESTIINEKLAAKFFPGEDPLGRRIRLREDGRDGPWLTIVGVVPSIRQRNFQEVETDAVAYLPYRQEAPAFVSILARGRAEPGALAPALRQAVREVDADQPVYLVQSLEEALAQARWPFRVFGSLFTIFAFIALAISAVGVYAVMAYAVTQRTQEIGMRMALGASSSQVAWLIVRQGLFELVLGGVLGLAAALGAGRVLTSLLVQVTPADPWALSAVTLLLVTVTAAACLGPARRAARLDPVLALRTG